LSVEVDEGGGIPVADRICKLTFKVVDTGCGFGLLDPSKLFQQYYMRSNVIPTSSGPDEHSFLTPSRHGMQAEDHRRSSDAFQEANVVVRSFSTTEPHQSDNGSDAGSSCFVPFPETSISVTGNAASLATTPASPPRKVFPFDGDLTSGTIVSMLSDTQGFFSQLRPNLTVSRFRRKSGSKHPRSQEQSAESKSDTKDTGSHHRREPPDEDYLPDVGIGIGLPMSKQIVDMMHGTISLRRETNGTTVLAFTIPAECARDHSSQSQLRKRSTVAEAGTIPSLGTSRASLAIVSGSGVKQSHVPVRESRVVADGTSTAIARKLLAVHEDSDTGNMTPTGEVQRMLATSHAARPSESPTEDSLTVVTSRSNWISSHHSPSVGTARHVTISMTSPIVTQSSSIQGLSSHSTTTIVPIRQQQRIDDIERTFSGDLYASVEPESRLLAGYHDELEAKSTSSIPGLQAQRSSRTGTSGVQWVEGKPSPSGLPTISVQSQVHIAPASASATVTEQPHPGVTTINRRLSSSMAGMRVLVVDDERAIRRLCQRMLERLGCTCVLLEDGDQVMDTLLASGYVPKDGSALSLNVPGSGSASGFQPFHAVLMDIMMVRSNGVDVVIDVLARFGSTPAATPASVEKAGGSSDSLSRPLTIPHAPPPFIAMTANTSLADITNYKRAGFVNVLGKPFDLSALRTKLLACRPSA
jgi:CheY-like chemotaxis protein